MTSPISVAVVGGTGFLGTVIVDHLERSGAEVAVMSRSVEPVRSARAGAGRHVTADLFHTPIDGWAALLRGVDVVVLAAGADERHPVVGSAVEHFHSANVDAVKRLCAGAVQAGVEKVVVLGSIFSAYAHGGSFSPGVANPYLRSRVLQEEMLRKVGGMSLATAVIRVPHAFGPGGQRLWAGLIRYCALPGWLPVIGGSVPTCAADSVAEAAVSQVYDRSSVYQCVQAVDMTLSHQDLIGAIRGEIGREGRLFRIPDPLFSSLMSASDVCSLLTRRPVAMRHHELGRFMLTNHPPPTDGCEAVAARAKVLDAIRAMVRDCDPSPLVGMFGDSSGGLFPKK